MYDLVALIYFSIVASRNARAVKGESEIFMQFNQPKTLPSLARLFPYGPVVLFAGKVVALLAESFLLGAISLILAAACYAPAFFVSRRARRAFASAAADEVRGARRAAYGVYETATLGLVYVGLYALLGVAVAAMYALSTLRIGSP